MPSKNDNDIFDLDLQFRGETSLLTYNPEESKLKCNEGWAEKFKIASPELYLTITHAFIISQYGWIIMAFILYFYGGHSSSQIGKYIVATLYSLIAIEVMGMFLLSSKASKKWLHFSLLRVACQFFKIGIYAILLLNGKFESNDTVLLGTVLGTLEILRFTPIVFQLLAYLSLIILNSIPCFILLLDYFKK